MLTVAYLGFGNSVCKYHLPYLSKRKDCVQVKYIYRRIEDVEKEGKDKEKWYPKITFTNDINDILLDEEVNLVVINTPNNTHVEYSMLALKHGKNILCEKPFAMSAKEAKQVFKYAKENGLIAMSNQNRRFDADFQTIKKVIDSKVLGDLIEIESHYDYYRPQFVKDINYFRFLFGLAVHPLDQIVSLFGKPNRVVADVRSIAHPGLSDDYYDFDLFYNGFKAIVKTCYYIKSDYPKFIVHGTKGSFILPAQGHISSNSNNNGPIEISEETADPKFWGTLSYFDDHNEDITMKVPTEITDYGKIYDNLNDAINHHGEKIVKDEEVISVLEIIKTGLQVAKEAK